MVFPGPRNDGPYAELCRVAEERKLWIELHCQPKHPTRRENSPVPRFDLLRVVSREGDASDAKAKIRNASPVGLDLAAHNVLNQLGLAAA